jgi:cytochrome c oxidase subunit 1
MTTFANRTATAPAPSKVVPTSKGKLFIKIITTTDHKMIGYMYLVTTFAWFLIGGLLALILRAELARPGLQFVSSEQYNQVFTMHGTIMLFLFATPLFVGFSNAIMPINGDLTKSEWLKYAIETRKNMVAGTLSVATGLVLGIAKVII